MPGWHKHKFQPARPIDDGCISAIHRCACGATYEKRKRRPKGATDEVCTWHPSIHCKDHPNKESK